MYRCSLAFCRDMPCWHPVGCSPFFKRKASSNPPSLGPACQPLTHQSSCSLFNRLEITINQSIPSLRQEAHSLIGCTHHIRCTGMRTCTHRRLHSSIIMHLLPPMKMLQHHAHTPLQSAPLPQVNIMHAEDPDLTAQAYG